MDEFPLFSEGDYGDFGDGLLADMSPAGMDDAGGMFELDQLYQNWLADGNEGSFADFKNELDNATDSSSDSDASGAVTGLDAGGSLTDGLKAFEGDGLLSPKPMIELSRPEAAPAPPPVSARGFASYAGLTPSATPASAQPGDGEYGPPIMPLTVESRVNAGSLTPSAQGFLGKLQTEHFPGLRAISGYRDPEYNRSVGGATNSRHTVGDAIDFDVSKLNDEQKQRFLNIANESGAGGVGIYPGGRSVHLDFRETPAVWGGNPSAPYSGNLNPAAYPPWARDTVSAFAGGGGGSGASPRTVQPFAAEITAASRETGVPESILRAKIQQESSFNPEATGRAGEIGLSQVMPSTARDPGFGVDPVDPATLRDPANNIMFGARYLAARGRAAGVTDWNDPEQAARGLTAYNGGGDPNYAQNVMRYVGGPNAQGGSAADLVRTVANSRGGTSAQQLAPQSNEERMAGIGAVPANPNGFAPARLPKLEPNTTPMGPGKYAVTQAELTGDSAGLLSPNMAIPGNVPLSNVPTMRGAIDPGYIYQDAVRTLPAQAPPPPPAPPGARPNTSRTQVAGDPPPNARSKNPPASSAVETRGRSMTPQNQVPPEYFTADTGGSGMGAMRFMEGEFARREGQQPPTFGGIGAAISNGMSGVGQAINSAISGAPPPPPVGAAPVQAAVSTAPAQASGGATQQAQAAGGPPSWYTPQVDAFLGGLSSALMSGNAAAFTPAYEAILASAQNRAKTAGEQAAYAQVLMENGMPAAQAALMARSPQAAQLMLSTLEKKQERARDEAFNQRAAAISSPTPSAPTASPAPTGQAPTAQPVANRPPAPSALEAERQRLVKMSEQYATLFSQAPSDRARQNLQFQINRVDAQIKSIDEANKAGVPAGFQRGPDGGIVPIPGGPQDPNFLRERKRIEAEGENLKPPSGYVYKNNVLEPIKGGPAEKIDGEIAGRIGLAKSWLENDAKVIEKRIDDGVFKGLGNTAAMVAAGAIEGVNVFGGRGHSGGFLSGEASETFRKLQSGTEVLTRLMTGAGMNIQEARQYAERYLPGALDTNANIKSKFQQLQREITDVAKVASLGRGNLIATDAGQQPPPPSSGQGAASASDPLEGRRAFNPETKERVIRRNGKWEPMP